MNYRPCASEPATARIAVPRWGAYLGLLLFLSPLSPWGGKAAGQQAKPKAAAAPNTTVPETTVPETTVPETTTQASAAKAWMLPMGRHPMPSQNLRQPLVEIFDPIVFGELPSGDTVNSDAVDSDTVDSDTVDGDTADGDAAAALLSPKQEVLLATHSLPGWLFLSLDDGVQRATVLRTFGEDLATAVRELAQQTHGLRRSGAVYRGYKLDWGIRFFPRLNEDLDGSATMERSLFALGLAEDHPSATFTLLPEEIVAHTLIDSKRRLRLGHLRKMSHWTAEQRLALKGMLRRPRLDLFRLDLRSVYSDGKQSWPLYRGNRRYSWGGIEKGPSADLLLTAAREGADYLVRSLDAEGRFAYSYLPKTDVSKRSYNILRHAGTTYSLLEMHQVVADGGYLEAAERALSYLRRHIQECAIDPQLACVVEDGEVKLGGNGLALLAFEKHIELTGQTTDLPLVQRLGAYLLAEQDASTRQFLVHKRLHPSGRATPFVSQYYPGEALLALVRHPEADRRWIEAALRGARWLISVRDRGLEIGQLAHDHWLLYALNEIHQQRPEPLLVEHAAKITQAIVSGQNRRPHYADWHGSFYVPPRSTPTATRAEGLGAAYPLLLRGGRVEEAEAALEAMRYAVQFQLRTRFDEVSSLYLPTRPRVRGGFRRSLDNYEIRIDYVQHNISALLALRRLSLGQTASGTAKSP